MMIEKTHITRCGEIYYWINDSKSEGNCALIFLPGLTAGHRLFDKQIEYFAKDYRVFVWDAPGHAASWPFKFDFSLMDKAKWLYEIIAREGIEKPVIIGRDPHECNLVYPQSSFEISRCHCVVRFNSLRNEFTLEDSGSTNGTFIVPNEGDKPKRIPSGRQYSMGSRAKFYVGNPRNLFEVRR